MAKEFNQRYRPAVTISPRERFPMATKPLACWICGKQVDLSQCKVDEHGLAVHESCYVAKAILKSQQDSRSSSTPPKQ